MILRNQFSNIMDLHSSVSRRVQYLVIFSSLTSWLLLKVEMSGLDRIRSAFATIFVFVLQQVCGKISILTRSL